VATGPVFVTTTVEVKPLSPDQGLVVMSAEMPVAASLNCARAKDSPEEGSSPPRELQPPAPMKPTANAQKTLE
jgi:hypothetical protein